MLNTSSAFNSPNDTTYHVPLSPEALLVYQVMIGTLSVGGTISNTLTCVAVFGFRRLRNAGNIFIANLSMGGVVYCALLLPVRLATLVNNGWVWRSDLCVLFGSIGHFVAGVIAFAFGGIAANRLVYIRYSAQYVNLYSPCGVAVQIVSLWLLSLTLAIVLPLSGAWGTITYHPLLYCCTFSYDEDLSYKYFMTSFSLYMPTGFVGICYVLIFLHVKKAQRGLNKWSRAIRRMTAHRIHVVPTASGGLASVTENSSTAPSSSDSRKDDTRANTDLTLQKGDSAGSPQQGVNGEFEAIVSVTEQDFSVSTVAKDTDIDAKTEGSIEKGSAECGSLAPNHGHVEPTERQENNKNCTKVRSSEPENNPTKIDHDGARLDAREEEGTKPETPKRGLWTVQGPTTQKVVSMILSSKQRKEAIRVTLMIVCASFMSVACTLPYYIVDMLNDRQNFPLGYMVAIISIALALNLNPIVYALMNARYRRAYKAIFKACFRSGSNNKRISPGISSAHV